MTIHIHHFHSKGAVADRAALEQFQKQWATYQKLVDSDALAHKEVGAHRLRRYRPDEAGALGHQGEPLSRHRSV